MSTISRTHASPPTPLVTGPGTVMHRFTGSPSPISFATSGAAVPVSPVNPNTITDTASSTSGTGTGAGAASPLNTTTASPSAASAAAATPEITEADFMQLLVTQLQNQDPMNPLQPYELAAQLAQFTSVQQLAQLNSQFTTQAASVNTNTQAVQANMATSLIGRPVVATGNEVDVASGSSSSTIIADIGGAGGQGVVTLTNAQGQTVGTYGLGNVGAGRQLLSVPTKGVAPGAYNYSLTVTDSSGNAVPVTTYVAGTVTGVNVSTATPTLDIGDLSVPISNLVEVLPTGSNPSSSTSQVSQ